MKLIAIISLLKVHLIDLFTSYNRPNHRIELNDRRLQHRGRHLRCVFFLITSESFIRLRQSMLNSSPLPKGDQVLSPLIGRNCLDAFILSLRVAVQFSTRSTAYDICFEIGLIGISFRNFDVSFWALYQIFIKMTSLRFY